LVCPWLRFALSKLRVERAKSYLPVRHTLLTYFLPPVTRVKAKKSSSWDRGWGLATQRKHGLSTEQFPVSAYVGSSKNLKDLKDPKPKLQRLPPPQMEEWRGGLVSVSGLGCVGTAKVKTQTLNTESNHRFADGRMARWTR